MAVTDTTLAQFRAAITAEGDLRKAAGVTVNLATGLVAFDLQAPAKNLYPVNTPLLAAIPRVGGGTGKATNWRQITAITGSGYDSMPWVPEGQRAGSMSLTEADKLATYVTIGEEESVTFEAKSAAKGFEDVLATSAVRLLQKMRLKEEHAILGGNQGVALGAPGTIVSSASGSGATLPALTYDISVVAMTYEGYNNWKAAGSSIVTGLVQTKTVTGQDGATFVLNGGYGTPSANKTQAVTLGQTLFVSVPAVTGAVAYAWYVGASGAAKLERVTTINSAAFTAALAGTGQLFSALAATDNSRNATMAFDGLLYSAFESGSGAYINTLATGTSGTGTVLTSSGRGSVTEIDTMLQTMWDNFQVSPSVIYVNSQQQKDITTRVLGNTSSAPLVRFSSDGNQPFAVVANGVVRSYFNPFSTDGGKEIPVRVHPTLVAGTILAYADDLPVQYQSANVPNVAEVKTREDYYQIVWPLTTRAHQTGVYAEEVLAVYAPFAIGVINNVAAG